MSSSYAAPLDLVERGLDDLASIDPTYRTTGEHKELLVGLSRLIARAEAERLRVLAASDDIAVETGDRSTATWLANTTRQAHGTVRRDAALARALDERCTQTATAFAAGTLNLAQAREIVDALDALPKDLGDDLRVKAEAHLVEQGAEHGPRDLKVLGAKILDVIAPDIAEEAEYQRLLAAERRAEAATRLTMRPRGDGSTDLHARIPDHTAGRLSAYLNAFTAPRRRHLHGTDTDSSGVSEASDEFADLPIARQRGIAFSALLENIPTSGLPRHGGVATTLTVTIDYQTLVRDLHAAGPVAGPVAGLATTSTGQTITAGQARRLACQAGILPVVLGANSEILDLGRTRRLVSDPIRKALNLRDKTCTAVGCTMPAEFCEAHHTVPWSRGGTTSLNETQLLCPFHHHRAHDPAWQTFHHDNGTTTYHRRT